MTQAAQQQQPSLFDRIGGAAAVNAAVDKFYEKVLADDRIKDFFTNVDMKKQAQHQKLFLTYAFGGAPGNPGKNMREAHKHLKLNDTHFTAVAECLQSTLEDLNVPADMIGEVMAIAASTHDDVLNL
jgi:hemoglobin